MTLPSWVNAMSFRKAIRWLPVLAGLCVGCNPGDGVDRQAGEIVEREGQPGVHYVADDDDRMTAAIAQARDTVPQFIATLNGPQLGQTGFAVKVEITDGENVEFMWLSPVRYDGAQFMGTLNNDPDIVGSVKLGDELTVAQGEVSDWMYLENSKLVGGFTLRVLRDAMSADERAEFDQSLPFMVD